MPEARENIQQAIYDSPYQQKLMTRYSVNMSTGGMFIETQNILPVNTSLEIKFKLPGNDTIITCNARVAWTNEPGHLKKHSLPPGIGIEFLDLSLEIMLAIRDYLEGNVGSDTH